MLDFPSYSSVSWLGLLFAIGGIGAFLQALYTKTNRSEKENINNALLLVFGPLFLVVGVLVVYSTASSIYRFRQLPVDQAVGLEVTRMVDESTSQGSRSKTFKNPESVQNALKIFRTCSETYRNHQTYSDGYTFTVLFDNNGVTEDYSFSAFRLTNGQADIKTVVIITGKEFSCPTFQQWIKDNIDPMFSGSK